jgi:hypothetical protein
MIIINKMGQDNEMDIRPSVEKKLKKGNQILFSRDSDCLQDLIRLIEKQKHRTLVMWALECAQVPLARFEARCPDEPRPRAALAACDTWARGQIKMPEAKRAILAAHAVAKAIEDKECIALVHAIGQAGSTVHTETHALGLVFYELTALVLRVGLAKCGEAVSEKIAWYSQRLSYWQDHIDDCEVSWAKFLLNDTRPNPEQLRNEISRN